MSKQLDCEQEFENVQISNTLLNNKFQPIVSNDRIKATKRRFTLTISLTSLTGCLIAIYQLFTSSVGLLEISLLLFMYVVCVLGITVGFHRHFTHQAFKTRTPIRIILAILGSMAGQGSVIAWVSIHRCHHQYSDKQGDPHSPNIHGKGILEKLNGLWHSHLGWLFNSELPNSLVFAKDLLKDPVICQINRLYVAWILLGLLIPAIVGGILTWNWVGIFQGFVWGGLARLFLTFNSGYIINSIAHTYGKRLFNTSEQSQNNIWLAIPTLGEGWHNNHHAFPMSANFGLKIWQIDLGYWVIRVLQLVGLATDIKLPQPEMIESKKNVSHPG
jgi:stearoyl-CoA desaturase (Delta-9 desaturase)